MGRRWAYRSIECYEEDGKSNPLDCFASDVRERKTIRRTALAAIARVAYLSEPR